MEAIAVIGCAGRFPGAASVEAYWDILNGIGTAIGDIPSSRFDIDAFYDPRPGTPGKTVARRGGFVADVDRFDHLFFGMTAREALAADPQQRLLLEAAWHALEDAAVVPAALAGSNASVYFGLSTWDYNKILNTDTRFMDAYAAAGSTQCIAANRLSHLLDLRGPSMAIDTACSSSLVAVHMACQSLTSGESSLAIAGGANLIVSPESSIVLSQAGMLAPDGSCKTFDAAANGYVRSEGCAVFILKRLADALRDGDPLWGVIRGSAVNHNGKSNGMTAPSGPAQHALIRQALHSAGVAPAEVRFVETHGTGTRLGDPIEAGALRAVYAPPKLERGPLGLGAAKAVIGHAEAAAGAAGLLKVLLAMRHQKFPAQPPLGALNPLVAQALKDSPMAVQTEDMPWLPGHAPRLAGVSSFGFGGANAHLIVEAPDHYLDSGGDFAEPEQATTAYQPAESRQTVASNYLLPLSARSEAALRELARHCATHLRPMASGQALADACYTAQAGRSHFPFRLCVQGGDGAELAAELTRIAAAVEQFTAAPRPPFQPAFVFSGQGTLYAGVAAAIASLPAVRAVLERCDAVVRKDAGWSLIGALHAYDNAALQNTAIAQPMLFALQCALAQTMIASGTSPSALLGHSLGEYAAAWGAGVFSLEDGMRLVLERARLMALCEPGAMLAVAANEDRLGQVLSPWPAGIELACRNGADALVLAGPLDAIAECETALTAAGLRAHRLATSQAFHSRMMAPAAEAFLRYARQFEYSAPQRPLISSVTGVRIKGEMDWPSHFAGQICAPVEFGAALATLKALAPAAVLELGAQPVLHSLAHSAGFTVPWIPTLRRQQDSRAAFHAALARCYELGARVNWQIADEAKAYRRNGFPGYRFERHRHWVDVAAGWNLLDGQSRTVVPALYLPAWQPCAAPWGSGGAAATTVILCGPGSPLNAFASHLRAHGEAAVTVWPEAAGQPEEGPPQLVAPDQPKSITALMQDLHSAGSIRLMLSASYFLAMDRDSKARASSLAKACQHGAALLSLLAEPSAAVFKPWLITEAAQAWGDEAVDSDSTAMWGLFKTALAEYPGRFHGMIDMPASADEPSLALLRTCVAPAEHGPAAVFSEDAASIRAVRDGQMYVQQRRSIANPAKRFRPRSDAAYLITGAFGGIGLSLLAHLHRGGANAFVLHTRRMPDSQQQAQLDALRIAGVRIELLVAASLDEGAVIDALARMARPLAGIFHLAGARADAPMAAIDAAGWQTPLSAKLDALPVLRKLASGQRVDTLVYFSSIASVVGSPAQANYVAANSVLEAAAISDRRAGIPSTCILWGPWAEAGAAAQLSAAMQQRLRRHGLRLLDPVQSFAMLDAAIGCGEAQVIACDADWTQLASAAPHLAWLAPSVENAAASGRSGSPGTNNPEDSTSAADCRSGSPTVVPALPDWASMPVAERETEVMAVLRATLAQTLASEPSAFDEAQDFFAQGLDSLLLVEWLGRLQRRLGFTLYPREAYQRPTLSALARYLANELTRAAAPPEAVASASTLPLAASTLRTAPSPKLAGAVFLLSAPRSGSTLLRAMLAGHGMLFAPPELHLLQFSSMRERHAQLSGSGLDEGLIRAMMELCALDADSARARIADWIEADLSTAAVYHQLQQLAGKRILVDKSPSYALQPQALQDIERWFDQPRFIHLTRDPHAMIESFERLRMHRILGDAHPDTPADGESVWLACNDNLLALEADTPSAQWLRLRYEDLVMEPEPAMRRLCAFLDIPFEAALLEPHAPGRMTDAVRSGGAQVGDPNFHTRKSIDASLAQVKRAIRDQRKLAAATLNAAHRLDYAGNIGFPEPGIIAAQPLAAQAANTGWLDGCTDHRIATSRSHIPVCEWGAAGGATVVLLHGWQDQSASWAAVARSLAAQGWHVIAPDLPGHGRCHEQGGVHPSSWDFVADIDALLLGREPVHLVGHSFGSIVAAMLAAARPDLVLSLTLIEPILPEDAATLAPDEALRRHVGDAAKSSATAHYDSLDALVRRLHAGFPQLPEAALRVLAKRIAVPTPDGYGCPALDQGGARLVAALRDTDRARYCALLATLSLPVLWLRGAHSIQRRPRDEQQLLDALAQPQVATLEGAHNLHIDSPAPLASALADFLVRPRAGMALTS
ncbi:alpha/beta fold hydrolase [Oxalobacteraceae bacterium]|nr:alpha/beta fold hydrolase [Oxalobacteraceae bacterium]